MNNNGINNKDQVLQDLVDKEGWVGENLVRNEDLVVRNLEDNEQILKIWVCKYLVNHKE